jgi:hypothetical protein
MGKEREKKRREMKGKIERKYRMGKKRKKVGN